MAPQRGSGSIAVPPVVASLEPLFRPLSGLATLKELKLLADLRRTSAGDSLGQLGGRAVRDSGRESRKVGSPSYVSLGVWAQLETRTGAFGASISSPGSLASHALFVPDLGKQWGNRGTGFLLGFRIPSFWAVAQTVERKVPKGPLRTRYET